jgi:NDP-sugar pyrophosphorylase family protein
MKTIFLASGKSSRCAPLRDKNFLEFCGEPLILKLLKNAHKGGLKNFIIVSNGENLDEIKKVCLGQDFLKNVEIVVQDNLKEGMAGGIASGLKNINNDESVFIMGGNDYVESYIYREIVETGKRNDGAILAKKVKKYFPGGYIEIEPSNNQIKSIIEKPKEGTEPSDLVNIIGHFFKQARSLKQALSQTPQTGDDHYEHALSKLFKEKKFIAVKYDGIWQAIKYPWHVLEMMNIFLKKQKTFIHPSSQITDSVKIKGDHVFIDSGVKIYENAVIQGPCYLGKNVIIGNNALVRESNLGKNSSAGYNTEIARSFLASNVSSHIAYIGDSIIDSDVNFGAYSCTANLRLDKKSVKVKIKKELIDSHHKKLGAIVRAQSQIGIHAMLMPGAKIEKHIGPGELVK